MRSLLRWLLGVARLCGSPLVAMALCACGGGSSSSPVVPPPPPPPTTVTISGHITFDLVPFATGGSAGLDFARTARAPARGVVVEVLSSGGAVVIASSNTDSTGAYSVTVPVNNDVFVRARAQMLKNGTPSWNFSVRDNTNTDALYVLDGSVFNSGTTGVTRDLNAPSGFTVGTGYTATRAAAPFAILDVVYQAYTLVLGADANALFPELRLGWSNKNLPCSPGGAGMPGFCDGLAPALARGEIQTTFFQSAPLTGIDRIYVLGKENIDTDEFDTHVVAHEWGHYYQDNFSRDDSIGGDHTGRDKLDLRVAFSEGWGDAFSGMATRDPLYRDSEGNGQLMEFTIDLENNIVPNNGAGWFNETSVQSILYDIFDSNNDGPDTISLGFTPIHQAMIGAGRTTSAFSSIYSFVNSLRAANSAQVPVINALLTAQSISSAVSDDFGTGELNSGGTPQNLPLYKALVSGGSAQACSEVTASLGTYNKLGNRKFFRFTLAATSTVTIRATSQQFNTDPDLILFRDGVMKASAEGATPSGALGGETLTATGQPAGAYVFEVYESTNVDSSPPKQNSTWFNVDFTAS